MELACLARQIGSGVEKSGAKQSQTGHKSPHNIFKSRGLSSSKISNFSSLISVKSFCTLCSTFSDSNILLISVDLSSLTKELKLTEVPKDTPTLLIFEKITESSSEANESKLVPLFCVRSRFFFAFSLVALSTESSLFDAAFLARWECS